MQRIRTSAPGKIILSGEYAVLAGAPAISMAVDRRAVVTVEYDGETSLRSIGLVGESDSSLLNNVCRALGIDLPAANVVMDTSQFSDSTSGRKLGVGSSAALTVALVKALSDASTKREALFQPALVAHREFQRGNGSGVDVATSVTGGIIGYRQDRVPVALNWPDGLQYALLWSGVAASTSAKLDQLAATAVDASHAALVAAAEMVANAWHNAATEELLGVIREYVVALRRFGVDHALGIFDAGHDELLKLSASADVVYKPCGAGGGDMGIVFGLDPEAVRKFAGTAELSGFQILDMKIDPSGVTDDGALA